MVEIFDYDDPASPWKPILWEYKGKDAKPDLRIQIGRAWYYGAVLEEAYALRSVLPHRPSAIEAAYSEVNTTVLTRVLRDRVSGNFRRE